jgi:hypothetical protein
MSASEVAMVEDIPGAPRPPVRASRRPVSPPLSPSEVARIRRLWHLSRSSDDITPALRLRLGLIAARTRRNPMNSLLFRHERLVLNAVEDRLFGLDGDDADGPAPVSPNDTR